MYAQNWGLTETPFTSVVDHRWFFESATHEEAYARLMFLVEQQRRFGVMFGPVGSGKSLLLNIFARELNRTQREVASVDLLGRTGHEMLWDLNAALGLAPLPTESTTSLWRKLQDHLQTNDSAEIQTVLIFDHAERASQECWDCLERLAHVQRAADQWTTLVVSVRSEDLLQWNKALRDLSDLRIELPALDRSQTWEYVETLLQKAGCKRQLFTAAALDRVFEFSGGTPRYVNRLCDLALLAALAEEQDVADEHHVLLAVEDLESLNEQSPVRHAMSARG